MANNKQRIYWWSTFIKYVYIDCIPQGVLQRKGSLSFILDLDLSKAARSNGLYAKDSAENNEKHHFQLCITLPLLGGSAEHHSADSSTKVNCWEAIKKHNSSNTNIPRTVETVYKRPSSPNLFLSSEK